MNFPITPSPPSAKAQALSQQLAQLVRESHAGDPTLGHHDVRQAFALAQHELAAEFGGGRHTRLMHLVLAAAGLLALLVALHDIRP